MFEFNPFPLCQPLRFPHSTLCTSFLCCKFNAHWVKLAKQYAGHESGVAPISPQGWYSTSKHKGKPAEIPDEMGVGLWGSTPVWGTIDSWQLLEEASHGSSGIQAPRGNPHSSSWSHNHAHNLMEIDQGASHLRHLRTTEAETGKGTGRNLLFPIF